jgi:ribonuclease BN (tRNA processing enzyme)
VIKLSIAGSGDAFGSGGRLQTCYHVAAGDRAFLIDCGATALIGLNRLGLDPNGVSTIFISHLHGDHFAGLVWWLIHAQHVAKRKVPLTVVGPPTIEARFLAAAEALFPGSTRIERSFNLAFREISEGETVEVDGIAVRAREVSHPSGAPSHALRLVVDGRVIAFSGDTEWVDGLVPIAQGADLFIVECYGFDRSARYHMNWKIISDNLDRLGAKRVMLTHMSKDMLDNIGAVSDDRVILAEDGLGIVV